MTADDAVAEVTQFVDALMEDPAVGDMSVSLDLSTGEVKAVFTLNMDEDEKSDAVLLIAVTGE